MNIKVVRNRFCVDSVGYKLFVPNNSVWKITDTNFWPDHIECKEWQVYKLRKYEYRDNKHNDYYNGGNMAMPRDSVINDEQILNVLYQTYNVHNPCYIAKYYCSDFIYFSF